MDKRVFMLLGAIILIGGAIYFIQRMLQQKPACDGADIELLSKDLMVGDSLKFSDISPNATKWYWDFGDGLGTSESRSGSYLYQSKGKYLIRLTVNETCVDSIIVEVSNGGMDTVTGTRITITASRSVVHVGEPVNFKGTAEGAKSWKWYFGENGVTIDDKTQNPTYTYKTQGDYVVTLKTDASLKVNGTYNIKVLPKLLPTVSSSKVAGPAKPKLPPKAEIINRLQNLADRGGYKTQVEKDWFNNYFISGQTTPVSWNIPDANVPTLDALVKEFSFNHPAYTILDVSFSTDNSGYISSLEIKAQKK
ncbi:MAG: PKD domain-containing protein [Chitinophagaceae bacterium]|nr:PKD domain-containing protein [Chitinophagaceae bacterium]